MTAGTYRIRRSLARPYVTRPRTSPPFSFPSVSLSISHRSPHIDEFIISEIDFFFSKNKVINVFITVSTFYRIRNRTRLAKNEFKQEINTFQKIFTAGTDELDLYKLVTVYPRNILF